MNWFKRAFAVDPPGPAKPNQLQQEVIDRVCKEIARRHLSSPATLFLEVYRPLNYVGSQVLYFLQPIVSAILTTDNYQHFTEFLERRGSVDYLCNRIEYYEKQASQTKHKLKSGKDFQAPHPEVASTELHNNID